METKLAQVQAAMRRDDWREALRIAARFPRLGPERVAIQQGWAALTRADFYRQMGKDPDALVEAGKAALVRRYAS